MAAPPYLSWASYVVGAVLIAAGLSTYPAYQAPIVLVGGVAFLPVLKTEHALIGYAVAVVLIAAGISTWPNMHTEFMLEGAAFFGLFVKDWNAPR